MPYDLSAIKDFAGLFELIIFLMSHGNPSDNKMANEFAPREFETPIPPSPKTN